MKLFVYLTCALLSCVLPLLSQAEPRVIPLWEKGAPGFENRRDEPEQLVENQVVNIHNPSLSVFPASSAKANGAAMLILPGGGHRKLVFNSEGAEPAKYWSDRGITCFVLKYRLARETDSPYSLQIHPQQDVQRAMRLIRSRAAEWNIDTNRIGALGFSAGGEVVAMLVYHPTTGDPNAADPIDRMNCRADFQISVYPGSLGIPAGGIPADAPPAFFVVANDDDSHVGPVISQLEKYRLAKRPVEVHLYAQGGHAFNMGTRSKLAAIKGWPQRMDDWLADSGFLQPSLPVATATSGIPVLVATSAKPLLEMVAPVFVATPGGSVLAPDYISSTNLIARLVAGEAAIGINTRMPKAPEVEGNPTLVATPVGLDALVVTVPVSNAINNLSSAQVCDIWTGRIRNWNELGGPDLAIVVIGRTKAYDPIQLFGDFMKLDAKEVAGGLIYREKAKEAWSAIPAEAAATDEKAMATMSAQPGAITYFPLGTLLAYKAKELPVKGLGLNSIEATRKNVANGTYLIHRTLNAVTAGTPGGSSKKLIDFLLSEAGQKLVVDAGFVALDPPKEPTAGRLHQ